MADAKTVLGHMCLQFSGLYGCIRDASTYGDDEYFSKSQRYTIRVTQSLNMHEYVHVTDPDN